MCKLLVVFCFILYSAVASAYLFKDCGSKVGEALALDIIPCSEVPCVLHKGQNATISIQFQSHEKVQDATASVHGIIEHIPIPFPLDDSVACHFIEPSCPIQPSQPYNYTYTLYVQPLYPSIRVTIRWELKTSKNNDIICIEFPAQLM